MRHATLAICLILLVSLPALAAPPADELAAAVSDMHGWVGDSDNGRRWKKFLRSAELESQLARGPAANRATVSEILAVYSGDTPGLEFARFRRVREALREWHSHLPRSLADFADAAETAKGEYRSFTEEEIDRNRARLRAAMQRLVSFLAGGSPDNAANWKRYLQWQSLEAQLAEGVRPSFAQLQSALRSFYGMHVGLELEQFTAVRQALREYLNAARFRYEPPSEQLFGGRLDELARRLREYETSGQSADAQFIGRMLGWLDGGAQLPELVAGIRQHYWQPNLHAQVSEELVAAGIAADVDQIQSVNEVILGTSLFGQAHLQGQLGLSLVPSTERACFEIEMTGVATSDNVGYNGPVTLYTNGVTQISGRKRVYLNPDGLRSDPAWAQCTTSSKINSIAAKRKLVRKIAWRRAAKTKPQSEQIASYRTELRVAGQIDGQAATAIDDANQQMRERLRDPLVRLGAFPQRVRFQTDREYLHVTVLQASEDQIAAPVAPPRLAGTHDLSVRAHESLVGNLSESMVGGRTVTDEQLVQLLKDAGATVPPELEIGPEDDPWSITFAPVQPVQVEFREGIVRIAISGRRFTRGAQEIRNVIQISAAYGLQQRGNGIQMARQGDVEVEYVNLDSLSFGQVAMKTFLRSKFEALFEPEIASEGLRFQGPWEKAGVLRLAELAAHDHWLTLGWQMLGDPIRTASAE